MDTQQRFKNDIVPSNWVVSDNTIKVLGLGGGGCNAVNYMFEKKIEGCCFIVCNTDSQALNQSPIPNKIQLGAGLGAGTDPTKARNETMEAEEEIKSKVLNEETKMLFITAGLGGGTGTGAAPVIAKMAKDMGTILTVAVITLPFKSEGIEAHNKAIDCIRELQQNVDSLIIINNQKLYAHFPKLLCQDAFSKTNEILAIAVKGIIEIIKRPGYINVDFQDVYNIMKNSNMAIMGCGESSGENRLETAVKQALNSPLLNDFDLTTAKKILVNITIAKSEQGLTMAEIEQIDELITKATGNINKFKKGIIFEDDPNFKDKVQITLIATGFEFQKLNEITEITEGNHIIIKEDFCYLNYEKERLSGEITLSDNLSINTIGFNTQDNIRQFTFKDKEKPLLAVEPKQDFSELENIAAIRRKKI